MIAVGAVGIADKSAMGVTVVVMTDADGSRSGTNFTSSEKASVVGGWGDSCTEGLTEMSTGIIEWVTVTHTTAVAKYHIDDFEESSCKMIDEMSYKTRLNSRQENSMVRMTQTSHQVNKQ